MINFQPRSIHVRRVIELIPFLIPRLEPLLLFMGECNLHNCRHCTAVHRRWCVGREGDVTSDLEVLVGTQYMQVVLLRGGIPLHCIATDTTPSELSTC